MTGPHSPLPGHDGCSCGATGYLATLSCGHRAWTHGRARPGSWISCYPAAGGGGCQAQRKVTACEPAGAVTRCQCGKCDCTITPCDCDCCCRAAAAHASPRHKAKKRARAASP
jgi:hypothetical protein